MTTIKVKYQLEDVENDTCLSEKEKDIAIAMVACIRINMNGKMLKQGKFIKKDNTWYYKYKFLID